MIPTYTTESGNATLYSLDLPWENEPDQEVSEPVTLCIAADCNFEGAHAIVLCCDWRAQTGSETGIPIGSDDVYKIRQRGMATILLAGHPTQADELLTTCKVAIKEFSETPVDLDHDLAINKFLTALRESAARRKAEIIAHHVAMTVGMSYAELKKLPPDNFMDTWSEIRRLDLGADLIITLVPDQQIIVTLDRWGSVQWQTNYAAIGEGSDAARAMLCLQPWDGFGSYETTGVWGSVPLPACLYRVYEAKQAAHLAHPSSVGEATQFEILLANGKRYCLNPDGLNVLKSLFKQKHRVPTVDLDKAMLVESNLYALR